MLSKSVMSPKGKCSLSTSISTGSFPTFIIDIAYSIFLSKLKALFYCCRNQKSFEFVQSEVMRQCKLIFLCVQRCFVFVQSTSGNCVTSYSIENKMKVEKKVGFL
jgi:hypothetical protein